MAENLANMASSRMTAAIDDSQTSVVVESVTGFPAANFRILINSELMLVTAVNSTTLTVTRNVESTTKAAHSAGSVVNVVLTAAALANVIDQRGPWQPSSSDIIYTAGKALTNTLVINKAAGYGIQVDHTTPTFGWQDMIGPIHVRTTGPTIPSWSVYRTPIYQFLFALNNECWNEFHIPHDYLPGSDLFIHAHWSHIHTNVTSGGVTWEFTVSYAKGHQQAAFSSPIALTIPQNASTTQYQHMIAEVQLSATSPSATQLDSAALEVDGLILCRTKLSANTLNAAHDVFLHFIDIHYQTTSIGTKGKAPNFYTGV